MLVLVVPPAAIRSFDGRPRLGFTFARDGLYAFGYTAEFLNQWYGPQRVPADTLRPLVRPRAVVVEGTPAAVVATEATPGLPDRVYGYTECVLRLGFVPPEAP